MNARPLLTRDQHLRRKTCTNADRDDDVRKNPFRQIRFRFEANQR